jgi:hypothetical protein
MVETRSSLTENFSITRGGPLHRLLVRLGHAGDDRQLVVRRALIGVLIMWLPLFVFSVVDRQAFGHQITIPFIRDFAVNVHFLIALPILILAESGINRLFHRYHKNGNCTHRQANSNYPGNSRGITNGSGCSFGDASG